MRNISNFSMDKDVDKTENEREKSYYMDLPLENYEKLLLGSKVKYKTQMNKLTV